MYIYIYTYIEREHYTQNWINTTAHTFSKNKQTNKQKPRYHFYI